MTASRSIATSFCLFVMLNSFGASLVESKLIPEYVEVINDSVSSNNSKVNLDATLKLSEIDSLKKVITKKQEQIDDIFDEKQKLKKDNEEKLISFKKENSSKDILIKTLQSSIEIKSDSIQKINKELSKLNSYLIDYKIKIKNDSTKLVFADRCIGRFSNSRLYIAYDENLIKEAIEHIEKIENEKIKKEFKQVKDLLDSYQVASFEFIDVLNEAQNDPDRLNKFNELKFRENYIEKLKNMQYYQKFYEKRKNGAIWTIPFLNKQISAAIEVLKKHKKDNYADFSPIIFDCTHLCE